MPSKQPALSYPHSGRQSSSFTGSQSIGILREAILVFKSLSDSFVMQDSRIAVVERALVSLAHLTEVGGGDFLRRRMKKEAWPILSQLLELGLTRTDRHRRAGRLPIQSSEAQAPAILARVRLATVTTLDRSAPAMQNITEPSCTPHSAGCLDWIGRDHEFKERSITRPRQTDYLACCASGLSR